MNQKFKKITRLTKTFDWDEEEVSDDEMTHVKVLMALADDELAFGKNQIRNSEWINITMRKEDALLHYDAKIKVMNLFLLSILNGIYNSVDACTLAKDMWKRVERLMMGTIQNKVDRETHLTNEFDQFVSELGEALVSVYIRFAQLMNDLERNDMHFPIVTINTKFLISLTGVVEICNSKKSHDPLALVAHTGSSSRNKSSYYVTHPTYVVDYDDEYQQDDIQANHEDPLASAMLLLARAITQNFIVFAPHPKPKTKQSFKVTGHVQRNLRTSYSGNTLTVHCYNCSGKGHYDRNCLKPRVRDSKYFMEQMLLAKQDEARVILADEQNDFRFADASRKLFQRDIKEMKDVFESTESELCELHKQNNFLKDQLLEASLKHQVELKKHKWDSTLKNNNTKSLDYSWISKMERLEHENVSLDFQVQSLIKERDNVKMEYQKLFDSIKKTWSQTQKEVNELIAHVSKKTYAYGAIRAEN
nr:hypothetical protein [Tanacetum cinerariifolium]